jgi:hypothetical protein
MNAVNPESKFLRSGGKFMNPNIGPHAGHQRNYTDDNGFYKGEKAFKEPFSGIKARGSPESS